MQYNDIDLHNRNVLEIIGKMLMLCALTAI